VIPKGTTHEFWKSVHAGAVKASQETGCEIIWKGPLKKVIVRARLRRLRISSAARCRGFAWPRWMIRRLVSPVKNAKGSGMPVVVFDSGLRSEDYVSLSPRTISKAASSPASTWRRSWDRTARRGMW
jgi:ribose transport system substrate-binding protein